jgi:hypothetical protein
MGSEMKIRRLSLTINELAQLQDNERTFLLIAGHMQNEFVALHKIFAWCISPEFSATAIESAVNGSQAFMVSKILAGKLFEGWQLMSKAYFSSKLSLTLAPLLHESTQHSLDGLKSYFSSSNVLYTVRNSFSFHYSAEDIARRWNEAAREPNFDFFIGNDYGNTFHLASEIAANMAVLNAIEFNDKAVALKIFLEEVQKVAHLFNDFLSGVMLVILERCFGSNLSSLGSEEEVLPGLNFNEVKIPFFYIAEETT